MTWLDEFEKVIAAEDAPGFEVGLAKIELLIDCSDEILALVRAADSVVNAAESAQNTWESVSLLIAARGALRAAVERHLGETK